MCQILHFGPQIEKNLKPLFFRQSDPESTRKAHDSTVECMHKFQNVGTGKQLPHQMEENISTLQGDSDGQFKHTYFFKESVHFGQGSDVVNFDKYFLKFSADLNPQILA